MPALTALLHSATASWPDAFSCPEILAAHLEVVNATALHCRAHARGDDANTLVAAVLAKIDPAGAISIPRTSSLLRTQLARLVAYRAVVLSQMTLLNVRDVVVQTAAVDVNAASAVLDSVAALVEGGRTDAALGAPWELFAGVCMATDAVEPRVAALNHLGALLEAPIKDSPQQLPPPPPEMLAQLWGRLAAAPQSPSLANSVVRNSGAVLAAMSGGKPSPDQLREWGSLVAGAGRDDKVSGSSAVVLWLAPSIGLSLPLYRCPSRD
jgi:hypothetical protein